MVSLSVGMKIKAEYFNPQPPYKSMAVCGYCVRAPEVIPIEEIAWMLNGALHTKDGWKPYNPHPSKGARAERSLSKKKTFI